MQTQWVYPHRLASSGTAHSEVSTRGVVAAGYHVSGPYQNGGYLLPAEMWLSVYVAISSGLTCATASRGVPTSQQGQAGTPSSNLLINNHNSLTFCDSRASTMMTLNLAGVSAESDGTDDVSQVGHRGEQKGKLIFLSYWITPASARLPRDSTSARLQ